MGNHLPHAKATNQGGAFLYVSVCRSLARTPISRGVVKRQAAESVKVDERLAPFSASDHIAVMGSDL